MDFVKWTESYTYHQNQEVKERNSEKRERNFAKWNEIRDYTSMIMQTLTVVDVDPSVDTGMKVQNEPVKI
jgi:hypothetical protein